MEENTQKVIKETIEQLLEKMGFSGEVTLVETPENESLVCSINTTTDSHFLIGQHGVNLQALQHLTRLMVRKHIPEKVRFIIDVNDYRQQKNQTVVEMARAAAQEALTQKRAIFMKPMSTYERRIVHLELSQNSEVVTESIGEGEERKIVVKPANLIS